MVAKEVAHLVLLKIDKGVFAWVNWEASLLNRSFKVARVVSWTPPDGRDVVV